MMSHPSTSVLLPTTSWTAACEEISNQLGPSDELLVICDRETDPVSNHVPDSVENIQLVIAGDPDECSGKANAIAAGMEVARHDRIVWTDDDFHHPDNWLNQLQDDYERQGPTTELPFFIGHDPLSVLLEPLYAVAGTAGTYASDIAWGGAVIFERDDLPDENVFLRDLRHTISDDGLLTDRIAITPVKRVRRVKMGGSIRETLERHVRFTQLGRYHDRTGSTINAIIGILATVCGLLFPLPALFGLTILFAGVYAVFRVWRWTFLLGYPAVLASMPLMAYGLVRQSFVWGGRRYRWNSKFDVELLE